MRLSQYNNYKLPVRMSMDASGMPVQSVKIINQEFDLSTTDIPDICKVSPIPAGRKLSKQILKFKRPQI